ncbi:uncharacterized protein Z520_02836 [Fonsecaea multimorphosa CBS 102226]|uniref:Uncharacterized protein n=1 Tax=Fonsecaea multimorphosa CBS 102226 TaxID=1442371 RepID=A0A0D2KWT6_9EURO|nr:uncharacterized protein Z520_02836 [Fonsecaea multimorphosa CBS 102226]KIY01284.1 hypothetical protein Z520_02836 [Fonsecaea multimorphosa CBS 102226]OAL28561.1 hypothetical protein AYO22_02755 [Fonsecaea multimorphosa]
MAVEDTSKIEAGHLFRVDGLVAVITGGGSGLGRIMARTLAVNGASRVFIIGRREGILKEAATDGPENTIIPIVGDVTSKESLQACVDQVKQHVDSVDVLVCNSGASGPFTPIMDSKQQVLPVLQLAENLWKPTQEAVTETYAVNLTGTQFTVAAFLPLLHEANLKRPQPPSRENFKPRPQIITTSSVAGFKRNAVANLSYGPSKAGVIHLTKSLATTLIPHDIRANIIAPGYYYSEMTHNMFKGCYYPIKTSFQ